MTDQRKGLLSPRSTPREILVRDARDRLSELLGLGEPYPLRDLHVPATGRTVPVGQSARIPVELSQQGVIYDLHDRRGNPVERPSDGATEPVSEPGTGATILLQTPPITEDATYKIQARKARSGRHAYLHDLATVKVGLDTELTAWIRSHPALDPAIDVPVPTDARLAAYGDPVEVEVEASQEGVDYTLVHLVDQDDGARVEETISVAPVRGTAGNIVLQSREMTEDTVVRVRATKKLQPSDGGGSKSDLLTIELPLAVKANHTLDATPVPGPIAAFGAEAAVRIVDAQADAQYRLHLHRIQDPEYAHNPEPDEKVVRVSELGEPDVQILRPDLPEPWAPVPGFEVHGDFAGGDGEPRLPVEDLAVDCLLIVEARKIHPVDGGRSLPSSVWLANPVALLRRPDPAPSLNIKVTMQGTRTDGRMRVSGGQAGVYYYFRITDGGTELKWPAYFHKRDALDSAYNQGVGQLEVEIDLSIATESAPSAADRPVDPARRVPEPPVIETGPLSSNTRLYARAVKAQTRIQAAVDSRAQIVAMPRIRAEESAVPRGARARILVPASREGQGYQLAPGGVATGPVVAGNGSDLVFETEPIVGDTAFEVWVTRPDDPNIPVLQAVPIVVSPVPDTTLGVTASALEVERGGAATVQVHGSESGVTYQLHVAGTPVGEAKAGTTGTIDLGTGPIEAETTFTVRASRTANPDAFADLDRKVSITVRTGP